MSRYKDTHEQIKFWTQCATWQTIYVLNYLVSSPYSQVLQPIGNEDDNHFTIDQEIIDKTKTKNVFNCKAEHEYQEEECLKNCLVDRFIKEVGCLHARLYEFANDTIREEIKRQHTNGCGISQCGECSSINNQN